MPNQEASTIASLFVIEWVARFGTPTELHSDLGAAFKSRLLEELGERLRVAHKIAARHQSKSRNHQKSCYERTANGPVYRIGDHVWLYRPKPPLGTAHKFHRPWPGPFVHVYVRLPSVCVIRDTAERTAGALTVHCNQLKPAQTPEDAQMRPLPEPPGSVPTAVRTVGIPAQGSCSNIGDTAELG
ncbi:uncharacterized protein DEA37_0014601 [Paragonimus westermani]|uniref:Integrase catalytic domain-containing protein n=1 Tax=Paragonimus westermani TaxID=34504 RepID=A0A5J4NWX1_9TREM|nr:uncharacterized protein DEA37_0014601 [Paragonimus westermani]